MLLNVMISFGYGMLDASGDVYRETFGVLNRRLRRKKMIRIIDVDEPRLWISAWQRGSERRVVRM